MRTMGTAAVHRRYRRRRDPTVPVGDGRGQDFGKGSGTVREIVMKVSYCAALVLSAYWWPPAAASAAERLEVGIARVEITPPLGYPMSGYYYDRGATGTLDPLEAKTIVYRQGDTCV